MTQFEKDKPIRSQKYMAWVREQACMLCFRPGPSDVHHIRHIGGFGGIGRKADDLLTIGLCRTCHNKVHDDPVLWIQQYEYIVRTLLRAAKEGVIRIA